MHMSEILLKLRTTDPPYEIGGRLSIRHETDGVGEEETRRQVPPGPRALSRYPP
jgi:hypothetical protein